MDRPVAHVKAHDVTFRSVLAAAADPPGIRLPIDKVHHTSRSRLHRAHAVDTVHLLGRADALAGAKVSVNDVVIARACRCHLVLLSLVAHEICQLLRS